MKWLYFLWLNMAGLTGLWAQTREFRFANFGSKDGLNEKVIYQATQDKRGYMWFATATGLYRFDGHRFSYYQSPIDRPGSTIANVLQAIGIDASGHLWLGSFTTLQWYNPETNSYWQPDFSKKINREVAASYFYNFSFGRYTWCSTAKNFVYRFNPADSSFLPLAPQYPAGASTTSLQTVEYGERLFDIHPEGIYVFSLNGKLEQFIRHSPADISNFYYHKAEQKIYLTSYSSGLLCIDLRNPRLIPFQTEIEDLRKNFLYSFSPDNAGNLHIGASQLLLFDTEKKRLHYFSATNSVNEYGFNASKIVSIFTDREGNTWYCSHGGLSMLPWQNQQVTSLALKDPVNGNITEPIGIYQEPRTSNLLILNTTSRGLQYVDRRSGELLTIPNPVEKNPLLQRITSFIQAPDSTIFVADDSHLFRLNNLPLRLVPFSLRDQHGETPRLLTRSVTDLNGIIYMGSQLTGYYQWNYNTGRLHFIRQQEITGKPDSINQNISPCIVSRDNHVWFTSSSGIYEYIPERKTYVHHISPPGDALPPMGESRFIAEDRQGHIWITTQNNGLYELIRNNGRTQWYNYTTRSGIGLPTDYCNKIKQSPADSCMWINNTAGLMKFDPVQKRVLSIFSKQNGFSEEGFGYTFNLFSDQTFAQLFYGMLNLVDLGRYRSNPVRPVVQINSVKLLDREMRFTKMFRNQKIIAAPNENLFEIEFAALLFNNNNKIQYAYRLEGADKDWKTGKQEHSATYSGLKPGSYTFRVKAANNDGLWGEETRIAFIIRRPFYEQWWFIAAMLFLIAILVITWNRYRLRQVRKEASLTATFRQKIAETEMKALRAQMNPHFIFNSLNSIQRYILKNDHFAASQYLTKFSRLIRLILDHSNQNRILLSSELEMLRLYIEMESMRFDHRFNYEIITSDDLQPDTVEIPSMLVQPYVENAIWHGLLHLPVQPDGTPASGQLLISFRKQNSQSLTVTIEDNGIGREQASLLRSKQVLKKKSYGMKITYDRIAIINQIEPQQAHVEVVDLRHPDGTAAGTKVILNLPIHPIFNS